MCCRATSPTRRRVEALVPAAEAALGSLDILVNNAGITRDNLFMRMKDEEWDEVHRRQPHRRLPPRRAPRCKGMMSRRFGRIIGITSVVGVTGNPGQGNYAASKAGMIGMTKSLAAEVASRNITVNCIAPGFIATAMTDALNDKQREAILARDPGGPARDAATRSPRRRFISPAGGRLCHRPDPSCEWRNGDDLIGYEGCRQGSSAGAACPLAKANGYVR